MKLLWRVLEALKEREIKLLEELDHNSWWIDHIENDPTFNSESECEFFYASRGAQ